MIKWLTAPLIFIIRIYQLCFSSILPPMCRFNPTCSAYAIEALKRFGPFKGTALAIWRICRCHPFTAGGDDPVPPCQTCNDKSGKINK